MFMKAMLVKIVTIYTYDRTTILLRPGTEVLIEPDEDGHSIATAPTHQKYPFDIDKSEYTPMN